MRHLGHRRAYVVEQATCHAAQHRGTQQDGLFRLCGKHGLSRGIGEQLADEIESPRAAADDHPLDRGTRDGLRLDDLAKAITDTANAGNLKGDQTVQVILHSKACYHGSCVRVGQRSTVSEELRNDMQALGQQHSLRQTVRRLGSDTSQHHG